MGRVCLFLYRLDTAVCVCVCVCVCARALVCVFMYIQKISPVNGQFLTQTIAVSSQ
jgi:hypothetical protein